MPTAGGPRGVSRAQVHPQPLPPALAASPRAQALQRPLRRCPRPRAPGSRRPAAASTSGAHHPEGLAGGRGWWARVRVRAQGRFPKLRVPGAGFARAGGRGLSRPCQGGSARGGLGAGSRQVGNGQVRAESGLTCRSAGAPPHGPWAPRPRRATPASGLPQLRPWRRRRWEPRGPGRPVAAAASRSDPPPQRPGPSGGAPRASNPPRTAHRPLTRKRRRKRVGHFRPPQPLPARPGELRGRGGRRARAGARRPRSRRARCCPGRRRHGQEAQEAQDRMALVVRG